ncbi:MAG: hypothetical protein U5R06_15845 [candidate division KSB1 bacterium]|nr:hypothetical protein [candidate division KSB1 bacterium]
MQGAWNKDHGKADIYIDGELDRTIDCYYWLANQEGYPFAYLYHNVTLPEGDHELRLVVTGDKNEKATDSKITINGAIVYEKK